MEGRGAGRGQRRGHIEVRLLVRLSVNPLVCRKGDNTIYLCHALANGGLMCLCNASYKTDHYIVMDP